MCDAALMSNISEDTYVKFQELIRAKQNPVRLNGLMGVI